MTQHPERIAAAAAAIRVNPQTDGNGAGAFYIHVRQNGAPGYDVRTVRLRPLDRGFRMPLYQLPDGTKPPVLPDHAHAPSLGYVAYLLTGDKFYAEEASFWGSYQLGEWLHKGLRWQGMDRAFAYGLRHVVDAAFILPDDHPLLPYFTWEAVFRLAVRLGRVEPRQRSRQGFPMRRARARLGGRIHRRVLHVR